MTGVMTSERAARVATRWSVRPPAPPAELARLMRELGIGPAMASIVWSRGLRDDVTARLKPPLALSDITTLAEAASRLERAIRDRERILIHGDYDADGISGTAVLVLGLRELGATVDAFLPNRLEDGYGIHPDRVPEHAARADLFVTVDCGISNLSEVAQLTAAGVDVIVTDHHTPGDALPDCLVVHPGLSPTATPGSAELTGAGVAFHLLWALRRRMDLEPPLEFADLATLGTIADVAPLLGQNRALIVEGLARMNDSRWPGLRAAVSQSSIREAVTARDVAFVLAPRLNAAGRLGEADKGLELLTTASERRARELAAYLDARNDDRRQIQDAMFAEALQRVDPDAPAIVIGDDDWHPGVMGIVASKILERFYRPVFIHAKGKGSVRSTPGISAVAALRAAAPHLVKFGGHAQAAGFTVDRASLEGFRAAILDWVATHPTPVPALIADSLLTPDAVEEGLLREVHELAPFGEGHTSPRFALTGTLEAARAVGRNNATLQLRVGGIKGVAWQMGDRADALPLGQTVTAIVELRENEWNGKRSIEFLADGIRPWQQLGFTDERERSGRIHRGRPAETGLRQIDAPHEVELEGTEPLHVRSLLLDADALAATETLSALVGSGRVLHFDLTDAALERAVQRLDRYPTIHDLRRGFVARQRRSELPFHDAKNELVDIVLNELDLVDHLGRARRGVRRDPISSATLQRGLVERYKLETFLNGYSVLTDEAFDVMVETIFGGRNATAA